MSREVSERDLMFSLLALDAYGRGYNARFADDVLGDVLGTRIGNAKLLRVVERPI